jgi:uncharacterized protein
MHQSWHDLLFAHWPISTQQMLARVPASLDLDLFDGQAWIGIVPFRMSGIRPRFLPALPWISAFEELNVRTYVVRDGKPGVFFFSLDAANPVAVRIARPVFHLPYFDAKMSLKYDGDWIDYRSTRTDRGAPSAEFSARYRPTGPVFRVAPGSLEEWLTERYCLYAQDRSGRVWRTEIHHPPWPVQPAECEFLVNTMTALPETKPLLQFSRQLDIVAWAPELLASRGSPRA